MRYLVTGGAGFIGSHIAETLASSHEVIIIDNLLTGRVNNITSKNPRIQTVIGDIRDNLLLKDLCSDVDGIFHEAALTSVFESINNPMTTHETNSTGTLTLLKIASESGVKKCIFASSAAIYGDNPDLPKKECMLPEPKSPYAVTKVTGEHYCKVFSEEYGLPCVALRYFNVFGPRQRPDSEYAAVIPKFIDQIRNQKPVHIFGDGEQTRDFVHVSDVVRANILAMNSHRTGVFNIASGTRTSLNSLVSIIEGTTEVNIKKQYHPERPGDIRHSYADVEKARSELGFSPKYDLKQGLSLMIENLSQ